MDAEVRFSGNSVCKVPRHVVAISRSKAFAVDCDRSTQGLLAAAETLRRLMETRVILAATLQRFEFSTVPKHRVRLDPQVVLSPVGALPLKIRARPRSQLSRAHDTVRDDDWLKSDRL
jgi:hypothetical protein